ncbi:MAG: hypothetical protein RLY93_04105 [Sumerlaeia bacterium]
MNLPKIDLSRIRSLSRAACAGGAAVGVVLALASPAAAGEKLAAVNGDAVADAADVIRAAGEIGQSGGIAPSARQIPLDLNEDGLADARDVASGSEILAGILDPPVAFQITAPPPELTLTADERLLIEGTVDGPAEILIGSLSLGERDGAFAYPVTLLEGLNVFTVQALAPGAEGFAGPAKDISIILDKTPPGLVLTAPAHRQAFSRLTATVSGNVSDNNGALPGLGARVFDGEKGTTLPAPGLSVRITALTYPAGDVVEERTITPDVFGDFSTGITLAKGLNDVRVTAIDAVGLENTATVRVRTFLSDPVSAESAGGARIELPEGAFPKEEMAVRVFDITTAEIEQAIGFELESLPPGGGLDDFAEGLIVLPNAMMVEVENGPPRGAPQFQEVPALSIPNVTQADNSMPLWIFQVQPDRDGDGQPELTLVSRAEASEDGSVIRPIVGGTGAVDAILPGAFAAGNDRFGEPDLFQVENAKAVRDLKDRLRGRAPKAMRGANVAVATFSSAAGESRQAIATPVPEAVRLSAPHWGPLAKAPARFATKGQDVTTIVIDDFDDGDLLNELDPPGLVSLIETGSSIPDSDDPIAAEGIDTNDLPGQGSGGTGGLRMRGTFGPANPSGEALISLSLLGYGAAFQLGGFQGLELVLDMRSLTPGVSYEVRLEDGSGGGRFVPVTIGPDYSAVVVPVDEMGPELDLGDLRRIVIRATGGAGTRVDLSIDNVRLRGEELAAPPAPTPPPTITPTASITATPSSTATATPTEPAPTQTPPPTMTATPPPPTPPPTPGPTDPPPPPEFTPPPTAPPTVPPTPTPDPQLETQVTFYCCAASAIIPFAGEVKCEDDDNVLQQRLRECIAIERQKLQDLLEQSRLLKEALNEANGRMTRGYQNALGVVEFDNGNFIPVPFFGSIFRAITYKPGAPKGVSGSQAQEAIRQAALLKTGLLATDNVRRTAGDLRAIAGSGSADQIAGARLGVTGRSLRDIANYYTAVPNNELPARLRTRDGFRDGYAKSKAALNLLAAGMDIHDWGDGWGDAAEIEGQIVSTDIQIEFTLRRYKQLINCDRGSNAWLDCDPEKGGAGETFDLEALLSEKPELRRRLARVEARKREAARISAAIDFFQQQVETFATGMESLRLACDISLRNDALFAEFEKGNVPLAELRAAAQSEADALSATAFNLQTVFQNADAVSDQYLIASEAIHMVQQGQARADRVESRAEASIDVAAFLERGDEGVVVSLPGIEDGNREGAVVSTRGGGFVGYRFARAQRQGDTVTFSAVNTTAQARSRMSLFTGSTPVSFPSQTYQFTPSQTVSYDGFADLGRIQLSLNGLNDDFGVDPPETTLEIPDASQKGDGAADLVLPPGAPFFLRARADDNTAIFTTRARIDGVPTEAIGSEDDPQSPDPYTFGAYFLTPELEGEGVQTFTVQAEAMDLAGNRSLSAEGTVAVDEDAPLLLEVSPRQAFTSTDGPALNYSATLRETGEPLADPIWFVEGTLGGNARVGFIDEEGRYTPPRSTHRTVQAFEIQVLSEADPTLIGLATVGIAEPFGVFDSLVVNNRASDSIYKGYVVSPMATVLNLGVELFDRATVLNLQPRRLDRATVVNPYEAPALSGHGVSPPVTVESPEP